MTQSDLEIHNLRTEFNVTMKTKNEFVQLSVKQRAEINSLKEQRNSAQKEANSLKKKLEALRRSGEENARVAELFRDHLDDSAEEQDGDNEWEQEARQITRSDIDASYAEGIDE